MEVKSYIAHEGQTLKEHLDNVSRITANFAQIFGVTEFGRVSGILHDQGKYTEAFQDYLQRSIAKKDTRRGEVIHALQGAKFISENVSDDVLADILGNVIAMHHGGLFDTISDGERTLTKKTNKTEDVMPYAEALDHFRPILDNDAVNKEFYQFCVKCQEKGLSTPFMAHLLTKALFSCVVDADRCDSAGINPETYLPDWEKLIEYLESNLLQLGTKSEINNIRTKISVQCQQAGARSQGIYALSVPTGGGKTLTSMRFALEHAKKHKLKRIIYVIPYLSILDQTAAKMREVFHDLDEELILEHHSNIEPPEDDDKESEYRTLTARWDSPIVLTTMVQFLESIYSNKASKLRKFHNMSESVIIFDEIQALPIKCIHLFNDAVNFLNLFGKSTILLCTATQPHLNKTPRPILMSADPDIVKLSPDELRIFERVCIEDRTQPPMSLDGILDLVQTQIKNEKSTLIIFNTKRDARDLYDRCKTLECDTVFLTTDLCPAHRLDILDRLRTNLQPETRKLTLCVSTQLIEAGVDISFDCVIRAAAGMDNIIQAAGRCNRNREKPETQPVYVVDVKDEKLSRLPEIKDGKDVTEKVFRETKGLSPLSERPISLFYQYFFYNQRKKMDYDTKDGTTTIYNLLNSNDLGMSAYQNRHAGKTYTGLPSAFQTASEEFSVIDGYQIGIVVPYGDAQKLVSDFEMSYSPSEKIRILKKLQRYTVSIYANGETAIRLKKDHAVRLVQDSFYVLAPEYYDSNEKGLLYEARFEFLGV